MTQASPLRSYSVQLIPFPEGVFLKRGNYEYRIQGKEALDIVRKILSLTETKERTKEEICTFFPSENHDGITALIEVLIQRGILYFALSDSAVEKETSLDVFYWNFGTSYAKVSSTFSSKKLAILGVNSISLQLVRILEEMRFCNFQLIDVPKLRNSSYCENLSVSSFSYELWLKELDISAFNCFIPTSDFGGLSLLKEFNILCFEKKAHLFPMVLQDNIGYVGPFVVPDATACFECFLSRRNSNLDTPNLHTMIEDKAYESREIAGFHPAMGAAIASFGLLELEKMYGEWMAPAIASNLIEINLIDCRLIRRKILKIPYCPVCSPTRFAPSTSLEKDIFYTQSRSSFQGV